jgi:hypothetical protein
MRRDQLTQSKQNTPTCNRCDDPRDAPVPETTKVHVDVKGDRIIATLPGTAYSVAFYKQSDAPALRQSAGAMDDSTAALSRRAFETLAWEAADRKARELGWIP